MGKLRGDKGRVADGLDKLAFDALFSRQNGIDLPILITGFGIERDDIHGAAFKCRHTIHSKQIIMNAWRGTTAGNLDFEDRVRGKCNVATDRQRTNRITGSHRRAAADRHV